MLETIKARILLRGTKAKTIIDDETFQEALKSVRQQYLDGFENSRPKDSEDRETAYMAIHLLKEVEDRLRTYISNALYEQNKP